MKFAYLMKDGDTNLVTESLLKVSATFVVPNIILIINLLVIIILFEKFRLTAFQKFLLLVMRLTSKEGQYCFLIFTH